MYEADKLRGFKGFGLETDAQHSDRRHPGFRRRRRGARLHPRGRRPWAFAADHQPAGEAARGAGRGAAVREGGALRADRRRVRLLRLRQSDSSSCTTRCSTRPQRRKAPEARLRIGMPGELRLAPDACARSASGRGGGLRGCHGRSPTPWPRPSASTVSTSPFLSAPRRSRRPAGAGARRLAGLPAVPASACRNRRSRCGSSCRRKGRRFMRPRPQRCAPPAVPSISFAPAPISPSAAPRSRPASGSRR